MLLDIKAPVRPGGSPVRYSLSAARLQDAVAPEPAGWSERGNGGPLATVMLLMSFAVAGLGYGGYWIMIRGRRVAGQGQQTLSAITGND